MKNSQKKNHGNKASKNVHAKASAHTIRFGTVQMTESMAFDFTMEFLQEQYESDGYLGFMQTLAGLVQRYDAVLADAERLGQDENMCRAIGASDIALTFIPGFRAELEKLEGQIN